jgi:tRNA G46 methylase TrmB
MYRILYEIKNRASNFFWNRKIFFYLIIKDFYKLVSVFDEKFKKKWKYWLEKYKELSNKVIRKKKFGNFVFWMRVNDLFSIKEVFVDKDYSLLNDFLPKNGDIVVDLGAGVGDYALLASLRVDKKGKVISVESDKGIFKLLVRNIEENNLKNVIPVNLFISSRKKNSIDYIVKKLRLKRVDLIKMDIEGYEYKDL